MKSVKKERKKNHQRLKVMFHMHDCDFCCFSLVSDDEDAHQEVKATVNDDDARECLKNNRFAEKNTDRYRQEDRET